MHYNAKTRYGALLNTHRTEVKKKVVYKSKKGQSVCRTCIDRDKSFCGLCGPPAFLGWRARWSCHRCDYFRGRDSVGLILCSRGSRCVEGSAFSG